MARPSDEDRDGGAAADGVGGFARSGVPGAGVPGVPGAEVLAEHLESHRAVMMTPWQQRLPLVVLGGALLVTLVVPGPLGWMLPFLALVGLMMWGSRRVQTIKNLEQQVNRAQELAMLRHLRPAMRAAWNLIPAATHHPPVQHRAVAVLSHCLDEAGAYESALVAYDRLLEDLPPAHPGAVLLRVQRALVALHTERLADADDALRKLRGPVDGLAQTPIAAAYRYALLLQAVRTAHYAEAIEESAGLLEALRPLGVEAAFGHALLAFCHSQRNDPAADDAAHARTWWQRATTLLPAATLRRRLPELQHVFHG